MKTDNDFGDICNKLDKEHYVSHTDEIKLTRTIVMEYINKDYDKFLKLKAEAEYSENYAEMVSRVVMVFNLIILTYTFITNRINSEIVDWVCLLCIVILLVTVSKAVFNYLNPSRWRKYILTILDEIERKYYS